jgi:hypothetical protein
MAKKPKYIFNPKSLSFEEAKKRPFFSAWRVVGFISLSSVLGLFMANYIAQTTATPQEKLLKAENKILMQKLSELDREVEEMGEKMQEL